jgi:UPF0716 family protein affecting phage T7 exclusion
VRGFLVIILAAFLIVDCTTLVIFANFTDWLISLSLAAATALFGLGVIYFVYVRYGALIRKDLNDNTIDYTFMDKLCIMMAGCLLILPGIGTDLLGLVLLLPFVRRSAVRMITLL